MSVAISSGVGSRPRSCKRRPLHADELVDGLDHVDGMRMVRAWSAIARRHRLADPPRRVGAELEAAPVVELLDRADEPEVALLDEVEQRQAAVRVAARDGDDEAQVGLDQLVLRLHVPALDALGQRDLLLGREQRHLADLAQVHAHGSLLAVLMERSSLGTSPRPPAPARRRPPGRPCRCTPSAPDHVDAEVVEGDVDVVDLLRCQVDVGEDLEDVLGREVALLAALLEERRGPPRPTRGCPHQADDLLLALSLTASALLVVAAAGAGQAWPPRSRAPRSSFVVGAGEPCPAS